MADYIDREAVRRISYQDLMLIDGETRAEKVVALRDIDKLPAVKVGQLRETAHVVADPRVYPGERRANYFCTACKRLVGTWAAGLKLRQLPNFCCWCGAEFVEEKGENEC